jgi:putative tRNA adenosine deaminase-associated protein
VSYFTAVIGRAGSGWRALDVDLEDVDSLDELTQLLRSASRSGEPVVAVVEREDEWFAFLRVDDEEECRAFVSDLGAAESSHFGDLLAPIGDVELPQYAELRVSSSQAGPNDDLDELDEPDDDSDDVVAVSVCSSRTMPRKPTSAVGNSRTMPSSMPRPARRIGTTSGFGADSRTPWAGATGVRTSVGSTRTSRVAS